MPVGHEETVSISRETLAQYEASAARVAEAEQRAADAQAKADIAAGRTDTVLASLNTKVDQVEQRYRRGAADAALDAALAGHNLQPHAREQFKSLVAAEVVVDAGPDGRLNARSRDYRPVGEFVAAALASPEYRHFGQSAPPAAPPAPVVDPDASMGVQAIQRQAAHLHAQKQNSAATDASQDPSRPFALGARPSASTFLGYIFGR